MYINWTIMYISFNYERTIYAIINHQVWPVNSMKKRHRRTSQDATLMMERVHECTLFSGQLFGIDLVSCR